MRRRSSIRRQRGQGMTEYIIIVAVIALLSITLVTQFGDTIRMWFAEGGKALVGQEMTIEDKMDGDVERQ